jgi:hypothetical protein
MQTYNVPYMLCILSCTLSSTSKNGLSRNVQIYLFEL